MTATLEDTKYKMSEFLNFTHAFMTGLAISEIKNKKILKVIMNEECYKKFRVQRYPEYIASPKISESRSSEKSDLVVAGKYVEVPILIEDGDIYMVFHLTGDLEIEFNN